MMKLLGALALAVLPTPVMAQEAPASPGRSTFTAGACAVEVATDERIDCGWLSVPENRAKPDSRMIRLPVMIFRSRAETPAPDPVIFLTGGPGNSALTGQRSGKSNPFLNGRDQVLLEPRGARLAQPFLDCPDITATKGEITAGRLRGSAAEARLEATAASCRASLVASGVDLDGYTSAEAADDIEDLRLALGAPQVNLYGLSYGTRLALTVARRHPTSVRSMVLDSVLPPEVNFDETASANLRRALNRVFDGCAVDPVCAQAWPNLKSDFAALIARADRSPLPIVVPGAAVEVRGAQVVDAIAGVLGDPDRTPLIPRAIGEAKAGRHDLLTDWIARAQSPSTFSWGLRLSVWCAEEAPFEDATTVEAQTSAEQGLGGLDGRAASVGLCRVWNVKPAYAVENTPVRSEIPTLILAGEYDPNTPSAWARSLLPNMPNAMVVELPGRGHGASFNACGGRLAFDFINDPQHPPSPICAARLPGANFGLSGPRVRTD